MYTKKKKKEQKSCLLLTTLLSSYSFTRIDAEAETQGSKNTGGALHKNFNLESQTSSIDILSITLSKLV